MSLGVSEWRFLKHFNEHPQLKCSTLIKVAYSPVCRSSNLLKHDGHYISHRFTVNFSLSEPSRFRYHFSNIFNYFPTKKALPGIQTGRAFKGWHLSTKSAELLNNQQNSCHTGCESLLVSHWLLQFASCSASISKSEIQSHLLDKRIASPDKLASSCDWKRCQICLNLESTERLGKLDLFLDFHYKILFTKYYKILIWLINRSRRLNRFEPNAELET